MRGRLVSASLGGVFAFALAACGPWLPLPPTGTHAGDEPILVPEAPPLPHVEIIPDRPLGLPDAVWVDGQWLFRGRRWEWEPGRWEVPRPGATYAPPEVAYLPGGRIAWYPGRWNAPAAR